MLAAGVTRPTTRQVGNGSRSAAPPLLDRWAPPALPTTCHSDTADTG